MIVRDGESCVLMNVLHVSPAFFPAHIYGGPIESGFQLCRYLALSGCNIRVLTTDADGPDHVLDVEKNRETEITGGLRVRYCPRLMRHSVSATLLRLLPSYIRWADLVHLTAVYSFPTIPTLLFCHLSGKPVVWSPRGALQRWVGSRHVRPKRIWEWMCRAAAPRRLVLHATSEEEAVESVKSFPGMKTVVIPNGVEIPEKARHSRTSGPLRLAFLGRLDPKKGIENLLAACNILKGSASVTFSLIIAGAGDRAYTQTLKERIARLSLSSQVEMVGEVSGEEKEQLFENADIVVVPSYTENFGMVVVEALAHGVPVIASKGTPWRRVEEVACGLWVKNASESLAMAVEQMSRMPLFDMGNRGREWMMREFSWNGRAREMLACYSALLDSN